MRVWEKRRRRGGENKEKQGVKRREGEGKQNERNNERSGKKIEKKWDKVELL